LWAFWAPIDSTVGGAAVAGQCLGSNLVRRVSSWLRDGVVDWVDWWTKRANGASLEDRARMMAPATVREIGKETQEGLKLHSAHGRNYFESQDGLS
jgi:hypothetical protein